MEANLFNPVDTNLAAKHVPRLTGQNRLVLDMLRREPITPSMAWDVGIQRLAARIKDLRSHGFVISTVEVKNQARYELVREP